MCLVKGCKMPLEDTDEQQPGCPSVSNLLWLTPGDSLGLGCPGGGSVRTPGNSTPEPSPSLPLPSPVPDLLPSDQEALPAWVLGVCATVRSIPAPLPPPTQSLSSQGLLVLENASGSWHYLELISFGRGRVKGHAYLCVS